MANVLSTTTTRAALVRDRARPRRCRRCRAPGWSASRPTRRASRAAARRRRAVGSREVGRGPVDAGRRVAPAATSRNVPPYASCGSTTWSPGPDERAQHRVLGGHAAREREAARRALERRRGTPRARRGSGCRCGRTRSRGACRPRPGRTSSRGGSGVTTAPVAGSAGWPAWIARVSKPGRSARRVALTPGALDRRGSRARRERLSTPTGWPPSSTSTAADRVERARTSSRAPARRCPIIGIAGRMIVAHRTVEHRGSRNARSMSESSSSVPLTSLAASGGSLLTLTPPPATRRARA